MKTHFKTGRHTDWAAAVAEFAVKVYSEQGEYEKVVAEAVSRLGQPCRDGGAEASQWLHCLAVTSLLLERLMSLHQLVGCAIGSQEILDALLLPAVSNKKVLYISHFRDFPDRCGILCSFIHGKNLDAQRGFHIRRQGGIAQVTPYWWGCCWLSDFSCSKQWWCSK